ATFCPVAALNPRAWAPASAVVPPASFEEMLRLPADSLNSAVSLSAPTLIVSTWLANEIEVVGVRRSSRASSCINDRIRGRSRTREREEFDVPLRDLGHQLSTMMYILAEP